MLTSGVDFDSLHGQLFKRYLDKEGLWELDPTPEGIRELAREYEVPMKGSA